MLLNEYRIESPTDPGTSYHAEVLAENEQAERWVYGAELHYFRVADIDALIELLQRIKDDDAPRLHDTQPALAGLAT